MTLLLYLAVQQVESNLIMPLVQHRVVSPPPAVALLAVVAFGILSGSLSVLFHTLAVVVFVAVKKLRVRDAGRADPICPAKHRRPNRWPDV